MIAAPSKRFATGIASLVFALAMSSCSKEKEPIVVIVDPPKVTIDKKKFETKSKELAASDHDIAQTDWLFSIEPEIDFAVKDEKKQKDGFHIWIQVTGVKLKLGLPIKTTIADDAPKYVVEHEKGHVKICTRIYKDARAFAQASAQAVLGKTVEGFGSDKKLALSNALQMIGQDIAAPYRVSTVAFADAVSSNYDQLCEKEDRKELVDKTIEEAFEAVKGADKQQSQSESKAAEPRNKEGAQTQDANSDSAQDLQSRARQK
ncbi:MAG: hypothetical protein K2Y39_28635 [Candidatus Obscuribacterales bacterium]|nr:hypothetical protein [Candidatus Obscuribacterales bacterium]